MPHAVTFPHISFLKRKKQRTWVKIVHHLYLMERSSWCLSVIGHWKNWELMIGGNFFLSGSARDLDKGLWTWFFWWRFSTIN